MVVLNIVIEMPAEDAANRVSFNILKREDATALECELALHMQELYRVVMEEALKDTPVDDVTWKNIEEKKG